MTNASTLGTTQRGTVGLLLLAFPCWEQIAHENNRLGMHQGRGRTTPPVVPPPCRTAQGKGQLFLMHAESAVTFASTCYQGSTGTDQNVDPVTGHQRLHMIKQAVRANPGAWPFSPTDYAPPLLYSTGVGQPFLAHTQPAITHAPARCQHQKAQL